MRIGFIILFCLNACLLMVAILLKIQWFSIAAIILSVVQLYLFDKFNPYQPIISKCPYDDRKRKNACRRVLPRQ